MLNRIRHARISLQSVITELARGDGGWILLTVAAGWFLSVGVRFSYPTLLPYFRAEFQMDLVVAGLLISALWFVYALGQFPGGVLGDLLGEGRILVISTGVSTLAIFVVVIAGDVRMLFLGTIAFGITTSLYGPTRFTIFTDIYDDRSGTAIGITQAAGNVGNTVLPALAAGIAAWLTWRAGLGILLPAFVGVTIALWLNVPRRTSSVKPSVDLGFRHMIRRIAVSVVRGGIPLVVAIQIILGFVRQGFLGFYPTYLVEIKGFSPGMAALIFGLYFALGTIVQPLTGMSIDRYGSKWTLAALIAVFAIGLFSLEGAQSVAHVLLITLVMSPKNGTGIVINAFVANSLFEDVKGSGLGFLRMVWMMVGAMGPIFVGYLGEGGLLSSAFLILSGITCVAFILSLLIPR